MLRVAVIRFLLFWGVWLLVPMAIDGITAIGYLWVDWRGSPLSRRPEPKFDRSGGGFVVSVLVPVYNAEKTLYRCLKSLWAQDFPRNCLEVLCLANGVSDRSRDEYERFCADYPEVAVTWIDLPIKGKSRALNAGILLCSGDIVINVDADTRLSRNAVSAIAAAFAADDRLGAASGSVQVERMEDCEPWWWRLLNACEICEYLQAFRIGRKYQTYRNSVFTLSGAFAAFRREVLAGTQLYDDVTVSEDTKLTFDIRRLSNGRWRIACVEEAQAFVEPVHSLARFMSQRLRWQRGEVEVLSLYPEYYKQTPLSALSSFVGRLLISDHTLAFPRFVWTFIIPFLYLLGYSLPMVAFAVWLTYFMYAVVEFMFLISVRRTLARVYRVNAWAWWHLPMAMPVYRAMTYWFRMAGMIYALTEPAQWSTDNELQRIARTWQELTRKVGRLPARRPTEARQDSRGVALNPR